MASKAVEKTPPLATPDAAKQLGLSDAQFRRIASQKCLEPADWYTNPHYKSGPPCPKWSVKDLRRVARHSDVKRLLEKNNKPKRTAEEIQKSKLERMHRKYGEPGIAIPDACEAMFNLNRYAKHDSCTRDNRLDIYALKEGLISHLITQGVLEDVGRHLVKYADKSCFGCNGSGAGWDGLECQRCDGTGIYSPGRTKTFIVFRFLVNENRYCWHSPADQFVEQFKDSPVLPDDWRPGDGERPLAITIARLSAGKDVIRYAIGQLAPIDIASSE